MEIIGNLIPYFSGKLGRRPVLCFSFISAGSFCVSSMLTALIGSQDSSGELEKLLFLTLH